MAVVSLQSLPEKLNPVIRPMMEAVKKEENTEVRKQAATCLATVMQSCLIRSPNPSAKIIKNLCSFLCCDPTVTPNVLSPMQQKPTGKFIRHPIITAKVLLLTWYKPTGKIVRNLFSFVRCDPTVTPIVLSPVRQKPTGNTVKWKQK